MGNSQHAVPLTQPQPVYRHRHLARPPSVLAASVHADFIYLIVSRYLGGMTRWQFGGNIRLFPKPAERQEEEN